MNFSSALQSSASASSSKQQQPQQPASSSSAAAAPVDPQAALLFAQGVIALFNLWPALRLAVDSEWGGPDSSSIRTWFVSIVVDEFTLPSTSTINPQDVDELADLLFDTFLQEFEVQLEDASETEMAEKLIKLWEDCVKLNSQPVHELERLEKELFAKNRKIVAEEGGMDVDEEELSGTDESDGDYETDEEDEEAPTLVERQPKQREEPEIDEDGFTTVKGKNNKGR